MIDTDDVRTVAKLVILFALASGVTLASAAVLGLALAIGWRVFDLVALGG